MIKRPPQGGWSQSNRGDALGSIWSSWNLDLQSNSGKVRISPRAIVTTDDITDLGVPVAFQRFLDDNAGINYMWSIAGTYVFRMNLANGYQTAFAKDTATGTPNGSNDATSCSSDTSDMISYGRGKAGTDGALLITTKTRINFFDSGDGEWLAVQSGGSGVTITTGLPHMLCRFGGRVYVTDNNVQVRSFTAPFDSATLTSSGSNFLDLDNKAFPVSTITFLLPTSNRIWVGTVNQQENGVYIFAWDGATAEDPNEVFFIEDASGILAGLVIDDVPWVIDNNGWLRVYQNGTFAKVLNGKLPILDSKFLKNPLSGVNDRWIHPRGIDLVDGRINILINNEQEDTSGTIDERCPSGVWEYTSETGWIHKMSLSLYTSSVTDHGINRVSRVGALYANKTELGSASKNGTMFLGAQIFSDASSTKEVIAIDDTNDTLQKFGYLVTPKIYAETVQNLWNMVYVRHRELLDSSDKIWVRYRYTEDAPTEATITWTSTTTFTTTTDVSAYENYEVEILQGKGGGKCSRITSVVNNAGTYTVTLEETFTGATSGTAKARFQFWKQAGPAATSQTVSFDKFPVEGASTWIQLKICMQFKGKDEIDDVLIMNKPSELGT